MLRHSVAAKVALATVIFFALPLLIYEQFQAADSHRRALLLDSLEKQGRLVAEVLRPSLEDYNGTALQNVFATLRRIGGIDGSRIKILRRPKVPHDSVGFRYIAYTPSVTGAALEHERLELNKAGIFRHLRDRCAGSPRLSAHYAAAVGEAEVITSITPLETETACWAIMTTHDVDAAKGAGLGRPYWQTPEVRAALAIYLVLAVLVMVLFVGVWRSLRGYAAAARSIRERGLGAEAPSFASINRVPELAGVAEEFDRMVATLRNAAGAIRHAAEDNAHAFKTPIATIGQSLEPLKKDLTNEQTRARRAAARIEGAVARLEELVAASRRMEEATAAVIEAPRQRLDLSAFVRRTLDGYGEIADWRSLSFDRRIEDGLRVRAEADILETILENLLENAFDFAPAGSAIEIALEAQEGGIMLAIADEGPGVADDSLESIFERYVSVRVAGGEGHFGVGLWLVRRNVEALGGTVRAELNRPRGLRVVVTLPRDL